MSVSFLLYVPLLLGLVAAYRCLRATRVMFSVGMGRHNSFVGYAACRYLLLFGNSKTNVLSDMLSDSIKYKDLRSEKHTYKSAIGSKRIENPYTQFRQIANQPAQ